MTDGDVIIKRVRAEYAKISKQICDLEDVCKIKINGDIQLKEKTALDLYDYQKALEKITRNDITQFVENINEERERCKCELAAAITI